MSTVYDSIISGLTESITDSQLQKKRLKRRLVSIIPVKQYDALQIRAIRRQTGLSQKLFADYLGVSVKTVEAWEAGTNRPSGSASRLLHMMELDSALTERFPFVTISAAAPEP
ncbi:MAG: helix-turn-helix domain-containing protein [Eubacteriales bacterium]|nr:helix-turn-helix domain-containing protein [Eubacteriales bacterium]